MIAAIISVISLCKHFYHLQKNRPNIFARAVSVSIINQLKLHNRFCLCLASVQQPYPFHLVFGFQLFSHAVSLRRLRHDQFYAASFRFVNLGAILSYAHPASRAERFSLRPVCFVSV